MTDHQRFGNSAFVTKRYLAEDAVRGERSVPLAELKQCKAEALEHLSSVAKLQVGGRPIRIYVFCTHIWIGENRSSLIQVGGS